MPYNAQQLAAMAELELRRQHGLLRDIPPSAEQVQAFEASVAAVNQNVDFQHLATAAGGGPLINNWRPENTAEAIVQEPSHMPPIPAATITKKTGGWMETMSSRAAGKLGNSTGMGFARRSGVWLGLVFVVDGIIDNIAPHKQETIKEGQLVQDTSEARKRGLIKLAAGLGVAAGAALI